MGIRLMKQRPPTKKMGRKQRKGSKSNPLTGVQWANWLDFPGTGGGGSGDPNITTISPASVAATAGATTITVNGSNFTSGSEIEFDNVAVATTYVSATRLTTSFDPSVADTINVTVRNPNNEESNIVVLTVTATGADPTNSWTKAEIIQWLVDHGVAISPDAGDNFTKAELLAIVEAYLNGDPVDDLVGG
jgi:IPT/TIG domain